MPDEKGRENAIVKIVKRWGSLLTAPGKSIWGIIRGGKK